MDCIPDIKNCEIQPSRSWPHSKSEELYEVSSVDNIVDSDELPKLPYTIDVLKQPNDCCLNYNNLDTIILHKCDCDGNLVDILMLFKCTVCNTFLQAEIFEAPLVKRLYLKRTTLNDESCIFVIKDLDLNGWAVWNGGLIDYDQYQMIKKCLDINILPINNDGSIFTEEEYQAIKNIEQVAIELLTSKEKKDTTMTGEFVVPTETDPVIVEKTIVTTPDTERPAIVKDAEYENKLTGSMDDTCSEDLSEVIYKISFSLDRDIEVTARKAFNSVVVLKNVVDDNVNKIIASFNGKNIRYDFLHLLDKLNETTPKYIFGNDCKGIFIVHAVKNNIEEVEKFISNYDFEIEDDPIKNQDGVLQVENKIFFYTLLLYGVVKKFFSEQEISRYDFHKVMVTFKDGTETEVYSSDPENVFQFKGIEKSNLMIHELLATYLDTEGETSLTTISALVGAHPKEFRAVADAMGVSVELWHPEFDKNGELFDLNKVYDKELLPYAIYAIIVKYCSDCMGIYEGGEEVSSIPVELPYNVIETESDLKNSVEPTFEDKIEKAKEYYSPGAFKEDIPSVGEKNMFSSSHETKYAYVLKNLSKIISCSEELYGIMNDESTGFDYKKHLGLLVFWLTKRGFCISAIHNWIDENYLNEHGFYDFLHSYDIDPNKEHELFSLEYLASKYPNIEKIELNRTDVSRLPDISEMEKNGFYKEFKINIADSKKEVLDLYNASVGAYVEPRDECDSFYAIPGFKTQQCIFIGCYCKGYSIIKITDDREIKEIIENLNIGVSSISTKELVVGNTSDFNRIIKIEFLGIVDGYTTDVNKMTIYVFEKENKISVCF